MRPPSNLLPPLPAPADNAAMEAEPLDEGKAMSMNSGGNPYSSPSAPNQVSAGRDQQRLREGDYFLAWLLFVICATGGGLIAGALVSATIGFIIGAAHAPETISTINTAIGLVVGLPISYLCFRVFVTIFIVSKVAKLD